METKIIKKYVGKHDIETTELDKFCEKIKRKYGYDIASRLLSAAMENLAKEEMRYLGYKIVSLDELTIKDFKRFPGLFTDYDTIPIPKDISENEKGIYKCLHSSPIFDHPYALYQNRLLCICIEPYNVSGKDITDFIDTCEKAGNHVEISGRGRHFPGRSILIQIFPITISGIEIVSKQ